MYIQFGLQALKVQSNFILIRYFDWPYKTFNIIRSHSIYKGGTNHSIYERPADSAEQMSRQLHLEVRGEVDCSLSNLSGIFNIQLE